MKKFCGLFVMLFALVGISFATSPYKMITLYPGWNVVSTPAILSGVVFSNGGEGISFSKLLNGEWISVAATSENIKPLDGFMVYNNNSENVSMLLQYKNVAPTESFLQTNLNYGWNLLGVVTTNSPFNNISAAVMSADFTDNGMTNYKNKVNTNYLWNSASSSINNPELGEAYGIFINQENVVYGAINNGGVEIGEEGMSGSITIPTSSSSKNTVLLKAKNSTLAAFVVKPSNDGLTLEDIEFTGTIAGNTMTADKIRVKVSATEYDVDTESAGVMSYLINEDLPLEGLIVEVVLKNEATGTVELTVKNINNSTSFTAKTFTAKYASALVYIASQTDEKSYTHYTLGVDKYDDDYIISDVKLGTGISNGACTGLFVIGSPTEDGDTFEINNEPTTQLINCISYKISGGDLAAPEDVIVTREDSSDYFKVNGASWRVFKAD